ncbi:MAG: hypothetical protein NZ988_05580 [Thaumarchaeota archaeon]|nr:hypothetical protein [Candidatus Calditenuaceae archaeon]MDW8187493.1 hypothetical protein [Nitrososphaerota archaeon]
MGISPAVATAILAGVTLFLGILLITLSAGWFSVNATDLNLQANREIQLIKTSGLLVFESVRYAANSASRSATVRNVSEVELCVTRVELIRENGILAGVWPTSPEGWARCDPTGLNPIMSRQSLNLSATDGTLPPCIDCSPGERIRLRVWYIARSLYDQNNPVNSADEMRFTETLIVFPGTRRVGMCTANLGSRYVVLSSIDPLTNYNNGRIMDSPNDKLYLGFSHSTPATDNPVHFGVKLVGRDNVVVVISSNLRIDVPYEQAIAGAAGISTPFSAYASGYYQPVPWEFYFDRTDDGVLHVSDIRLITQYRSYLSEFPILTSVQLTLGKLYGVAVHDRPVNVYLTDCNGVRLATLSITISAGSEEEWITVFIDVPEIIEVTELAKVEVYLR